MRSPIDFITLTGNREVCLTEMIDALEQLVPWLNTQLDNNFDRKHQFVLMGAEVTVRYNICP